MANLSVWDRIRNLSRMPGVVLLRYRGQDGVEHTLIGGTPPTFDPSPQFLAAWNLTLKCETNIHLKIEGSKPSSVSTQWRKGRMLAVEFETGHEVAKSLKRATQRIFDQAMREESEKAVCDSV